MLTTFDRALLKLNRWVVIVMLASMALMVFANVALRFLTDHSILWVEEVSRYLMIWLTFLGAGIVLRYGAHIGIDTLQERVPRAARRFAPRSSCYCSASSRRWSGSAYDMPCSPGARRPR